MTLSFKETKSSLCTRLRRVVFSSDLGKIDMALGQPDNQIEVFSQCKNFSLSFLKLNISKKYCKNSLLNVQKLREGS